MKSRCRAHTQGIARRPHGSIPPARAYSGYPTSRRRESWKPGSKRRRKCRRWPHWAPPHLRSRARTGGSTQGWPGARRAADGRHWWLRPERRTVVRIVRGRGRGAEGHIGESAGGHGAPRALLQRSRTRSRVSLAHAWNISCSADTYSRDPPPVWNLPTYQDRHVSSRPPGDLYLIGHRLSSDARTRELIETSRTSFLARP